MTELKQFDFEDKPVIKVSKWQIASNIFYLILLALVISTSFILSQNYKNILFAIRRPDMVEAARRVEEEEARIIQAKIAETKKQTLKKILSPLVVINNQ